MSKLPVFGCKEIICVLKNLGFEIYEDRGKGGHYLAKHSTKKPLGVNRIYSNITIPRYKEYSDPKLRSQLITEIRNFGYFRDEIIAEINRCR